MSSCSRRLGCGTRIETPLPHAGKMRHVGWREAAPFALAPWATRRANSMEPLCSAMASPRALRTLRAIAVAEHTPARITEAWRWIGILLSAPGPETGPFFDAEL